jgi:hypothetical protein
LLIFLKNYLIVITNYTTFVRQNKTSDVKSDVGKALNINVYALARQLPDENASGHRHTDYDND